MSRYHYLFSNSYDPSGPVYKGYFFRPYFKLSQNRQKTVETQRITYDVGNSGLIELIS
jgi:hypothetical protein